MDGREREWFAKGPSQVLRLSATLALMDWAWCGGPPPSVVEAASLESAVQLWRGYFWPHAVAAVRQVGVSDRHADARKVLRWLKGNRKTEVAREEVRVEALANGSTPRGCRRHRFTGAGWMAAGADGSTAGRYARRWDVNPHLAFP